MAPIADHHADDDGDDDVDSVVFVQNDSPCIMFLLCNYKMFVPQDRYICTSGLIYLYLGINIFVPRDEYIHTLG